MKKLLSIVLSLCMLLSITAGIDFSAAASEAIRELNENITWSFDTDNRILTISGSGNIPDYSNVNNIPWVGVNAKTLVIKSGITGIGENNFNSLTSLKNITIPDTVKRIGENAFNNTKYYSDDSNWSNGILYIGKHLIKAESTITGSYILNNDTLSVAVSAFAGCVGLTSVTFPNTVTYLSEKSFIGCTGLTSISMGNNVVHIGKECFKNCTSLNSIKLGTCLENIQEGAFYNTAYYNNVLNWKNGVLYISNYLIKAETISGAYKVLDGTLCIADSAFFNCKDLTGITLPDSIKTIGKNSFYNCSGITNVTISGKATKINDYAFAYSGIKSLIISEGVKYIGKNVFYNCESLKSVSLSDDITIIDDSAFERCYNLDSITLPKNLETIGKCAFGDCRSLESINIPNSVKKIGERAFSGCNDLENISMSDNISSIGSNAFINTAYYTNTTHWIDNCLYIGNALIKANSSAKGRLIIKNGTRCIADEAFVYCVMSEVSIPSTVKYIGTKAFSQCGLVKITIPNSVVSLGDSLFLRCNYLESVTVGNCVTELPGHIFFSCDSLRSVVIGKNVKKIKSSAFYNKRLSDIYYAGSINDWNKITIYDEVINFNLTVITFHYNYVIPCDSHNFVTVKATTSKNGGVKCSVCGAIKTTIYSPKTIALSTTSYTYDGKVKKPTVTVKDAKGKTLKKGTDYTVTYASGRKNVGKYSVKVAFKGNYSGTKTLYFTIKPKNTSITSLTAGSKKFTVKLKKYTTQTTGYEIQYATSSSFSGAKTVAISNTTTSKTIKGLKAKKKYYVRVRTYKTVNGTKYYSSWSKSKTVTTK